MEMHQLKQLVEAAGPGQVLTRLLDRRDASLSDWYGDPVSREVAQALAVIAESELRTRLCEGGTCFQLHVLLMICHFWMGDSIRLEYEQQAASTRDRHGCALLELVYGQLLISCKCQDALQHLTRGFSLAAGHLDSPDYFRVLRQHELLDYLPVASRPSPSHRLNSLLAEAGVIKRLKTGAGRRYDCAHYDTVG